MGVTPLTGVCGTASIFIVATLRATLVIEVLFEQFWICMPFDVECVGSSDNIIIFKKVYTKKLGIFN